MAFQRLIQSNIDRAFSTVGDLAEVITIAAQAAGSYDFGTGRRTAGATSTPIQVRALVIVSNRTADGNVISPSITLQVPSHTLTVSLDEYTRITRPDGNIYDVVSWEDDGFLTSIQVRRDTR